MCTRDKAIQIVQEMSRHVRELYPDGEMEVILFGSYARHEFSTMFRIFWMETFQEQRSGSWRGLRNRRIKSVFIPSVH